MTTMKQMFHESHVSDTKVTDRQIRFIKNLLEERDLDANHPDAEDAKEALAEARQCWGDYTTMPRVAASVLIDYLIEAPRKGARPEKEEAPEGMHMLNGVIYKVQIARTGSGRPYAKRLVEGHKGWCPGHSTRDPLDYHTSAENCPEWVNGEWTFEYAPGAVRKLSPATLMTMEEARKFGALYGTCCVCGRTLTKEASIKAGIGPVCAATFR